MIAIICPILSENRVKRRIVKIIKKSIEEKLKSITLIKDRSHTLCYLVIEKNPRLSLYSLIVSNKSWAVVVGSILTRLRDSRPLAALARPSLVVTPSL